jgi:hypothetical protein
MPQTIQVGTILVKESPLMPELFDLDIEHYSGNWNVVKTLDAFALDRKIRGAGWSFFFLAAEVKGMFFGALGAKKIQNALHRIFGKVRQQSFNALEVTGIVRKRAFDVVVFGSALSRDTGSELAGVFRTRNSKGKIIEIIPSLWTAPTYRPDVTILRSDEATRLPAVIHSMFG